MGKLIFKHRYDFQSSKEFRSSENPCSVLHVFFHFSAARNLSQDKLNQEPKGLEEATLDFDYGHWQSVEINSPLDRLLGTNEENSE